MTTTKTAAPCKACASMIYRGIGHTCPKPDCYYHVPVAAPVRATGGELREDDKNALNIFASMSWYSAGKGYEAVEAAYNHLKQRLATTPAIAPGGDVEDALVAFFRSDAGAAMGRHGDSMGWTPQQTAKHFGIPYAETK